MAEEVVDLITGERTPYRPAMPQADDSGMGGINPEAVTQLFQQQKIADAERALGAAMQFQGLRSYQNAITSGDAPEKAWSKFGPMILYRKPQSFGASLRALRPPSARPVNALEQARIDEIKRRAALPQPVRSASPGSAIYGSDGRILRQVPSAAAQRAQFDDPTKYETRTTEVPAEAGSPAVAASPAEKRSLFGMDWLARDKAAVQAQPAVLPHPAYRSVRKVPIEASSASALLAPKVNEVVRKTKDGRRAVFNADTKEFLRYAD